MIVASIVKDIRLLLTDRGALASMFILPIAFITVFGFLFRGQGGDQDGKPSAQKVSVALYAPEGKELALAIAKKVEASPNLSIQRVESEAEVDRLVSEKKAQVGLVIPADLDPKAGRPMQFWIDRAASAAEVGLAEGAVKSTAISAYFEERFPMAKAVGIPASEELVSDRAPTGLRKKRAKIDSFQITVPSNAVLFAFFMCIPIALSIAEERRLGTWKRLLSSPVGRRRMLISKLVPFFIVGLIQMLFLFGIGALVFGMQVSGSWPAVFLVAAATVFSAVGLGFLVASLGGSEKQVASLASVAMLVMGLVSGCMFPRALFPEGVRSVGLAFPHGWALDAFQDALVREGTRIADVGLPILVILGLGLLYTAIGSRLFRFES